MTDQNNKTTVETSQTNSEATLEQWQHLPYLHDQRSC